MSMVYFSNPLFVDLDGALIRADLLAVSFIELFKRHPLQAPFWLLRGKADGQMSLCHHCREALSRGEGSVINSLYAWQMPCAPGIEQRLAKRRGFFYICAGRDPWPVR